MTHIYAPYFDILQPWLCFHPWYTKLGHRSAPLLCSHGEAQISTRTKWSPRYKKLGSFPMASLPLLVCKQCSLIFSYLWPLLLQLPSVLSKMDSKLLSRGYALVRKMMLHHVFPLQSKQIQIKFYSYQVMIDGREYRWVFLKGGKGP